MIGSMAPDFGVVLPGHLARAETHSLSALFTFALPAGFFVWALFQLLLKPALLEVLPDRWYASLRAQGVEPRGRALAQWRAALLALLAGAISHLLWDGFTHEDGMWVGLLPFLINDGLTVAGRTVYWFEILQHLSSAVGLGIVVSVTVRWVRAANRGAVLSAPRALQLRERVLWAGLYLSIPTVFVLGWVYILYVKGGVEFSAVEGLTYLAVIGLIGLSVSLLLVSLLLRSRLRIWAPSSAASA
jgi:hypothetical protein